MTCPTNWGTWPTTLYAEVRELESYVLNPTGPESQARDQRMLDARLRALVRRGEEC